MACAQRAIAVPMGYTWPMRLTSFTDYTLRTLLHLGSNPGRLVTIQEIADLHGISKNHLMKVVHELGRNGVIETIRGANPSALTAAMRKAASDTGAGGASSTHFASKGRTLGSASQPSQPVGEGAFAGLQRLITGNGGLADMAVRFVALYFVSLFAFDSFKAAEESPYNIRARR